VLGLLQEPVGLRELVFRRPIAAPARGTARNALYAQLLLPNQTCDEEDADGYGRNAESFLRQIPLPMWCLRTRVSEGSWTGRQLFFKLGDALSPTEFGRAAESRFGKIRTAPATARHPPRDGENDQPERPLSEFVRPIALITSAWVASGPRPSLASRANSSYV
jgi:hypothetical protein